MLKPYTTSSSECYQEVGPWGGHKGEILINGINTLVRFQGELSSLCPDRIQREVLAIYNPKRVLTRI